LFLSAFVPRCAFQTDTLLSKEFFPSSERRTCDTTYTKKGIAQLAYRIQYAPIVERHLRALRAGERAVVFDSVEEQLANEPCVETRNREPMRPNPIAPWELRIGHLRVYYDIEEEPEAVVTVLAVGMKDRNRILIGGEEFEI